MELSLPVESEPTAPLSGPAQRLRRLARVTEVSGLPAPKVGTECILRAMPTGQQDDCVAEVTCGATRLFPTTAPALCTYEGGRVVSVASAGGSLLLGMTGSSLVVIDSGQKAFQVKLALDP